MYGRRLTAETGSSSRSRYDSAVLMRRSLQPELGPAGTNTANRPTRSRLYHPPRKSWQPTNRPTPTVPHPRSSHHRPHQRPPNGHHLDALSYLLATLLTAQTPSSCPTQLPHDPSASASSNTNTNTNTNPALTDARILQILLSLHPPAGLHALHRLRTHGSHPAADDLAALQDYPSVSSRRVARFVAKWGWAAFPERAFDGVQRGAGAESMARARHLPPGQAGEVSVAGLSGFRSWFREGGRAGRRGVRVKGVLSGVGRIRRRFLVLDGGVGRDRDGARGSSSSSSREGSDRLVERCRGTVEPVLRLLGHVAVELDVEMWRRRRRRAHCARFLPDGCWRVGGEEEEEEGRVAKGEIEGDYGG